MLLTNKRNINFSPIRDHVIHTSNQLFGSGAATFVIHNDSIVLEEYFGSHSNKTDSRKVQEDSQFHVASVRKSYIGFAVAYAVFHGMVTSIDDAVLDYLPELDEFIWKDTTIRHLLTHTHGIQEINGNILRVHPAGEYWSYEDVGINVLTQLVKRTTQKTVSHIVHEHVFKPLAFHESDWYVQKTATHVDVILEDGSIKNPIENENTEGSGKNMFVSPRELAFWGYFHLKKGVINGKQVVPKEIIQMATTIQSPPTIDIDMPQNGFLWFVQELPAKKTEIGPLVPSGSYQILGYTGVTLLVIPKENLVAVRMFNSYGSAKGFDYLADVRSFGDTVINCLKKDSK